VVLFLIGRVGEPGRMEGDVFIGKVGVAHESGGSDLRGDSALVGDAIFAVGSGRSWLCWIGGIELESGT